MNVGLSKKIQNKKHTKLQLLRKIIINCKKKKTIHDVSPKTCTQEYLLQIKTQKDHIHYATEQYLFVHVHVSLKTYRITLDPQCKQNYVLSVFICECLKINRFAALFKFDKAW